MLKCHTCKKADGVHPAVIDGQAVENCEACSKKFGDKRKAGENDTCTEGVHRWTWNYSLMNWYCKRCDIQWIDDYNFRMYAFEQRLAKLENNPRGTKPCQTTGHRGLT